MSSLKSNAAAGRKSVIQPAYLPTQLPGIEAPW
jgi:hypothetical protein